MIEFDTYRYHGHSMSDPGSTYRTRDEISTMRQQRDPVEHVRKLLLDNGFADASDLKKLEKACICTQPLYAIPPHTRVNLKHWFLEAAEVERLSMQQPKDRSWPLASVQVMLIPTAPGSSACGRLAAAIVATTLIQVLSAQRWHPLFTPVASVDAIAHDRLEYHGGQLPY